MYAEDSAREVVVLDNDYVYANASTPAWSGGQDGCGPTSIQLGEWTITSPSLVPTCILAAVIGITCGLRIKRSNAPSSSAYSNSFFMFACMMTDAMIFHCFLHDKVGSAFEYISAILDVGLTSSIGLSFGFNALFDMGVMKPGLKSNLIMLGGYIAIIGAWIYGTLAQVQSSFMILYIGVVAVCCGLYSVITLVSVVKSKGLGFKWLALGVFFGGIGLGSVFFASWRTFLCAVFSKWFSSEFWWFLLSDVSMYYLYRYFMTSHVTKQTSLSKYAESDSDEDYESDEDSDEEVQRLIKPRTRVAMPRQQPHVLVQPQQPQQQQQQIVYIPMPYYSAAPAAYYPSQATPVYYTNY